MNKMKLLVTGGLGFIGSNFIINQLQNREDVEIVNIDKIGVGANPESLKPFKKDPRYRFIKGDISQTEELDELVSDVDAVVNFAAETHVDRSISDPEPFIRSNYLGTYSLLEAERKTERKIRHIQVSTDEVYGDILEGSFTEEDALSPSNPYSATKAAADLLCRSYHRTYGMDVIVTRCTNNYGPRQFPEKLIPKTIIRAINNLEIPVYGTGENIRDWLYVKDHCNAIEEVIKKGKQGEVYNISSRNEIQVINIVKRILEYLDKPKDLIAYVEDRPGHDLRYSLDSTKIRRKLDWEPEYSFKESLKDTVDWYLNNRWWWKPLTSEETLHPTPWKLQQ